MQCNKADFVNYRYAVDDKSITFSFVQQSEPERRWHFFPRCDYGVDRVLLNGIIVSPILFKFRVQSTLSADWTRYFDWDPSDWLNVVFSGSSHSKIQVCAHCQCLQVILVLGWTWTSLIGKWFLCHACVTDRSFSHTSESRLQRLSIFRTIYVNGLSLDDCPRASLVMRVKAWKFQCSSYHPSTRLPVTLHRASSPYRSPRSTYKLMKFDESAAVIQYSKCR